MSAWIIWLIMGVIGLASVITFLVLIFGPRADGHLDGAREPWER